MSLFNELKRRNVFKVAVAYAIVAWLLLQVSDTLVPALHLPEWFNSGVAFLLIIGFPIAMIFAWAFEMTPEGLKKEKDVDRSQSITSVTGQKLNNAIIGVLVLALGYFAIDKFILDPGRDAAEIANAVKVSQAQVPEVSESSEPDNSIAVLPFINMSSDKEQEYFSDGLTEELLNLLAKIPGLQVAARTSSFTFKGQNLEIPEIAARLKVAHVLEGSVRKSGDQVRITAQLIRADNGYHLWSETYDRKLENIFAVQDEIASEVVAALKVTLLGENVPTVKETNPEAYALFLQGRFLFNQASKENYAKSVDVYQRAISIDPDYAPAWAGLSQSVIQQAGQGWIDLDTGVTTALEAAQHAVTLDPELALGWVSLSLIQSNYQWNWTAADVSMQKALELEPNASYVLTAAGRLTGSLGQLDKSVALYRQASAMDPLNQPALDALASILEPAGQLQEAEAVERHLYALNPNYFAIHTTLSWILLSQGNAESALIEAEQEPDEFWGGLIKNLCLYSLGRIPEADAALEAFIENFHAIGAYQIAQSFAWRDQHDKAFEWLNLAYEQHDPGMGSLLKDSTLRNLHADPRWLSLVEKIGLLDAWNEMPAKFKGPAL